MRTAGREQEPQSRPAPAATPTPAAAVQAAPASLSRSARRGGPTPAQAVALQRAVGNRAAARKLARWIKHPDPDKKGVMVPDSSAAEYNAFNPPQNK